MARRATKPVMLVRLGGPDKWERVGEFKTPRAAKKFALDADAPATYRMLRECGSFEVKVEKRDVALVTDL